jgi:2-dehydropantoate 2-reductase
MKILIYGAGVIGSIYAVLLHEAGCNVTLLARGKHYQYLKENGVIIKEAVSGKRTVSSVPLISQLNAKDCYDLIILTVCLDQLEAILPVLNNNHNCPLVMTMLNNPENPAILAEKLKQKQVILGFPGQAGAYRDNVVNYIQIKQQKTTIGEISGEISDRLKEIKALFEKAGFKMAVSVDMEAWLKIHAVFIACISAAIMKENGDPVQLSKKRSTVKIMISSIREGFRACQKLGIPIAPFNLKMIFMIMPNWFSVFYWQRATRGQLGILGIAPHANKAAGEMKLLAQIVLTLVHSSDFPTPTLDSLLSLFITS